jgi:hypothetical protein
MTRDMYGHLIHVSDNDGGGGFGVSVTWQRQLGGPATPVFSFFHESDGYRQALFSVDFECQCLEGRPLTPRVVNIFKARTAEVLALVQEGTT